MDGGLRCTSPSCGESLRPGDRFCEACGTPIPSPGALPPVPADGRDHVEAAYPDLAGVSDRGLRRRRNEDAMALARVDGYDARILVVCDGVSASAEPAAASAAAAQAAAGYLVASVRARHPHREDAMREAVALAQRAVARLPYAGGSDEPPASTLVAAVLTDGIATIAWVGDSRAYFIADGRSWQLSRDDTWASEQVQLGLMREEEALSDPRAHVLTNWLGGDQEGGPTPSVETFVIPAPGCLLLCSDGLWNYAPSAERMRELVTRFPEDASAGDVARGLTAFARSQGGLDNITVVVAFV